MSVKPKYVDRILHGRKTIEFRKVRPKIEIGDILLIYASSPIMELKAQAIISNISQDKPIHIWNKTKNIAGLSQTEFSDYFQGKDLAIGIHFGRIHFFQKPITLQFLRNKWPGFMPPQNYTYFTRDQISFIIDSK